MVDIGKLIGEKLASSGMTQAELGRRINRSKQAVQHLLNNPSISTELLESICEAMNYDFFVHYTSGAKNFEATSMMASPVSITLNVPADRIAELFKAAFGETNGKMLLAHMPRVSLQPEKQGT